MIDPIDMVRQVTPPVEAAPELVERVRNDLMTTINLSEHNLSEHDETKQSSHQRRRWTGPIGAVAVLVSAAAGWAAVHSDSSTTTSVLCPGNHLVQAVTGDPVADCAEVWRDINGTEPPPMTAYDTGGRGFAADAVAVLVDGEAVPDGYVVLESGPHQDTTLIELATALDDLGGGLPSSCFDEADARDLVRREFTRLGLSDWTVTVDESRPPTGAASCAHFITRPDRRQIELIGMGPGLSQPTPHHHFASELNDRLNATCVGLDAAADITRTLASATDVSSYSDVELTEESGALDIHTIEDPSATCTRVDVNVGGVATVILRGPAS